jgi:hypothetical protein
MPFPKLRRNTNNQTTRRAETLRKTGSENLTLGDDHAHKITSKPSSISWETKRRLNPKT